MSDLNDHSRRLDASGQPINLAVFGTSIMWGQGLPDADKIHNVLARKLEQHSGRPVRVTFLAHSGASTGFLPDGSEDPHREALIDGEIPTLYPTILQEIEAFDGSGVSPEGIDAVILDAGINDVHVTSILNPMTTPRQIAAKVEIYCYQHMKLLLDRLLRKFPDAQIVLVSYYEFVTEESEDGYLRKLLRAFPLATVGYGLGALIITILLRTARRQLERRLLINCDTFSDNSLVAFQRAAQEVNATLPAPRVSVAELDIKPANAAFASDPWLFGLKDDLTAEDPMVEHRTEACHCASALRTNPIFCDKASTGHPNARGAIAYADAILACLKF